MKSLIVIALLWFSLGVAAQELTPRAYWPAPEGTHVVTVGFSHLSGDAVPDLSLPVIGVDSNINTSQVAYLQTISLFGRTANVLFDLPYTHGSTRAGFADRPQIPRDYNGVGDMSATLSVNLLGAPSMDREDFRAFRADPRPLLAGSIKIMAPTGDYDSDRLINVGANRWATKVTLGAVFPLSRKWVGELELGSWFFGDNDDFLGLKKEQDPIASLQAHLVHRFAPGLWASLDANLYKGGRSKLGGRRLNDLQRDAKWGFTLAYPVARTHIFKIGYAYGSLNDSNEDFDVFLGSYSRIF